MRRSNRGQPPNQADALFIGNGRLYPSRRYDTAAAAETATVTAAATETAAVMTATATATATDWFPS